MFTTRRWLRTRWECAGGAAKQRSLRRDAGHRQRNHLDIICCDGSPRANGRVAALERDGCCCAEGLRALQGHCHKEARGPSRVIRVTVTAYLAVNYIRSAPTGVEPRLGGNPVRAG